MSLDCKGRTVLQARHRLAAAATAVAVGPSFYRADRDMRDCTMSNNVPERNSEWQILG